MSFYLLRGWCPLLDTKLYVLLLMLWLVILSLFESWGGLFKDEDYACFLSALLFDVCPRHLNSISSPFSIVSLVFIGLDKLLIILGFIGDGICDIWGKVGCHMNMLLTLCDWLHVHGINIGCSKNTRVSLGDCWDIFGILDSCWVLMQIFIQFYSRTLGEFIFVIIWSGALMITTHGAWPWCY